MAMNHQYVHQQTYIPSAAPRRGSFVRGDSNMSSPPDARLGVAAHGSENNANSNGVTKKYVCSLCAGCRPTKRSNIEQHIWQRHAAHHGGDSYLHRYRATDHKNLVARFVREVVISDGKSGAEVHIPSTPPPAMRSPTPEAAANVHSMDCTASTASSPNMNISTATTLTAASELMPATHEIATGNTAHTVRSVPESTSDMGWDAKHHHGQHHGQQQPQHAQTANRVLQRTRSWGVGNNTAMSKVEPATFVRRLISQATGINTDKSPAATSSPKRSMSYESQASTGGHHHHNHGHHDDYHRRCGSGAADSEAVLAALAELLRRGEVEIVHRSAPDTAHQQHHAAPTGSHHRQRHHQGDYADRRHEAAICSPSMGIPSTTSLATTASASSLPAAASTTPPPSSSAHNHQQQQHHHQGRQQHQPRPARQQRDLLSVLLEMGSTHSSSGSASSSPPAVPAYAHSHSHQVQTTHRHHPYAAPSRMLPMQGPAGMDAASPSSIWRPVDL